MDKKIYDLMIIGNGFDLNCGLKTNYNDYLNYQKMTPASFFTGFFYRADIHGYLANKNWNGFEEELGQLLGCIHMLFTDRLFSKQKEDDKLRITVLKKDIVDAEHEDLFRVLKCISGIKDESFVKEIFDQNKSNNFVTSFDSASEIDLIFSTEGLEKSRNSFQEYESLVIRQIEKRLQELETSFSEYLSAIDKDQKTTEYERKNHFSFIANRVLSFNYTSTNKALSSNIQYVHGSIEKKNVLFGIDANMSPKIKQLSEIPEYLPFFKRARRILKNCNPNYSSFINSISEDSNVAIFGHSLDKADASILKPIFDKRLLFDIYYHRGKKQADYEKETKIRLMNLVGINQVEALFNEGRISFIPIN